MNPRFASACLQSYNISLKRKQNQIDLSNLMIILLYCLLFTAMEMRILFCINSILFIFPFS